MDTHGMKTFNDIVAAQFSLPVSAIRDDMTSHDVPEWDSMSYLLFIAELEKEFGMSFSMDEVLGAKTLGDLRTLVEQRKH